MAKSRSDPPIRYLCGRLRREAMSLNDAKSLYLSLTVAIGSAYPPAKRRETMAHSRITVLIGAVALIGCHGTGIRQPAPTPIC